MKNKIISVLLAVFVVLSALVGMTSCGNDDPSTSTPEKLSAPSVTLNGDTVTWQADPKADKFEISIDGELSYLENTTTSKALTEGQTFKIRAVGDGTNYTTSDWSNSVTYTAGDATTPHAPESTPVTPDVSTPESTPVTPDASTPDESTPVTPDASTPAESTPVAPGSSSGTVTPTTPAATSGTVTPTTPESTDPTVPTPSEEPEYLGILASVTEPSATNGLPDGFVMRTSLRQYGNIWGGTLYRQFSEIIEEYFENSANHLAPSLPPASDHDAYSKAGETVYIQIWLNNPGQHTILSLMLNGTKYQVGGGLSSFFIEESGQHYNCVYVAIPIPADAHTEKTYTVSNIEYIANTYINADGTDEFMNENDTVSIGLPYDAQTPAVFEFETGNVTVNSASVTFKFTDSDGFLADCSCWRGVAIHDGMNIVANQIVSDGDNTLNVTGLVENTTYWVTVYLYGDFNDGKGVTAHIIHEERIMTPEVLTVDEASGTLLYDTEKDGYYGAIKVNTTLGSPSAEYIKLEILDREGSVIYTDTEFNGTATVSENILCGNDYTVRIHYKDTEYPEGKYTERSGVWVDWLGEPRCRDDEVYTFVKDAVYQFKLDNGDGNYAAVESFVLRLYDEESERWRAEDILYYLNNTGRIEELEAQKDELHELMNSLPRGDEMDAVHAQLVVIEAELRRLDTAKWYLEHFGNNQDKAYWQTLADSGKYICELEYNGTDTDKIFKLDKTFYALLEGVVDERYKTYDVQIDFKYDKRDGNGLVDGKAETSVSIENHFICAYTDVRNAVLEGDTLTFNLVNIDDYMNSDGGESVFNKGYVYTVVANKYSNDEAVLYTASEIPTLDVDEAAWFAEYIRRIKAGESVELLHEDYVSLYEESYSITVDASKLQTGYNNIYICTRFMAEEYGDGEYDHEVMIRVEKKEKLAAPAISFDAEGGRLTGEDLGGEIVFEAKDKDGNPVELEIIGYGMFTLPEVGTQVRVMRKGYDSWLDSDFSEWYTFEGVKLASPSLAEFNTNTCTMSWSMDNTENVARYVYTVNGGAPVTVELDGSRAVFLNNGDVLRVKCVSAGGIYIDSDWAEYTCVDERIALGAPTNITYDEDSQILSWDAADNADYYVVEMTFEGGKTSNRTVRKGTSTNLSEVISVRVRAMTENTADYRPGAWSESIAIPSAK